jgi:ketosteroid isomerase-like protein
MLSREKAERLAKHWIESWNAHDIEAIMAHYADDVELISPVAVQILNRPNGRVVGKKDLRDYFKKGLEAYPDLHFVLKDIMCGIASLVLYYTNQKGTHTGEYMEVSGKGLISRVVANYSA